MYLLLGYRQVRVFRCHDLYLADRSIWVTSNCSKPITWTQADQPEDVLEALSQLATECLRRRQPNWLSGHRNPPDTLAADDQLCHKLRRIAVGRVHLDGRDLVIALQDRARSCQ